MYDSSDVYNGHAYKISFDMFDFAQRLQFAFNNKKIKHKIFICHKIV